MTVEEKPTPATAGESTASLSVGSIFSAGTLNVGRVLAMAVAAAPPASDDPVDQALVELIATERPDIPAVTVSDEDVDPARLDRRFSLTRVRDLQRPAEKGYRDVVIMRGDLAAVLKEVKISREDRSLVLKNADLSSRRGFRTLAVASAIVEEGNKVGDFRLQGFIELRPETPGNFGDDVAASPDSWARVNVWSVSLRYQHWANVIAVFILSCTGYYMLDPFFGPTATDNAQDAGFLMGWIRAIHFVTAFVWVVIGAARVVSGFRSRDRYLRWRTLWPLKSKQDVKHLGQVVGNYAFLRNEAPLYLAHNPLQQLAYTSIYIACGVQFVTGFALYGLAHKNSSWFWGLISTPVDWLGTGPVRLLHALLMFLIWAFVIMHVYMAIRADSLERHGGISSMINGGVWMRRGSKPVDAPKIG